MSRKRYLVQYVVVGDKWKVESFSGRGDAMIRAEQLLITEGQLVIVDRLHKSKVDWPLKKTRRSKSRRKAAPAPASRPSGSGTSKRR